MKNLALALVAAAGIAAPALAQTTPTSGTFELRLVPQGAASGLVNGGSTSLSSVTFFVQARVTTANNTTNYGINRWSQATITASSGSTLTRANSSSGTRFGRFAAPAPQNNFTAFASGNSAANSASGNAATPSTSNDVNGRIAVGGGSIGSIDAYNGAQFAPIAGTDPIDDPSGNPLRPFLVTNGGPSAWANLYAFTITANPSGTTTVTAAGNLNMIALVSFQDAFGGNWFVASLNQVTPVTTTFSFIPTPGAAALLGLGGLMAARRRR